MEKKKKEKEAETYPLNIIVLSVIFQISPRFYKCLNTFMSFWMQRKGTKGAK